MKNFLSGFDFSNYSKNSKVFDETNKKVFRKMKDEFGEVMVTEFVGLKQRKWVSQLSLTNSKMFCLMKKLLDTKWKEFKVKNIN